MTEGTGTDAFTLKTTILSILVFQNIEFGINNLATSMQSMINFLIIGLMRAILKNGSHFEILCGLHGFFKGNLQRNIVTVPNLVLVSLHERCYSFLLYYKRFWKDCGIV